MRRIFAALVISYALVISAALVLGWRAESQSSFAAHFAVGLFATIFTCFVYCVVLTYLVITGKMIKQAVLARNLDPALVERSQRPKKIVLRLTFLSCGLALAAALMGALIPTESQQGDSQRTLHLVAQLTAVTANFISFAVLHACIDRQSIVVTEVFDQFPQPGSAHDTDPGASTA